MPSFGDYPIVIDTDAGSDDYMAIAYLLMQEDILIEAITTVPGLSRPPTGVRAMRRLLDGLGRNDIPVYLGKESPLEGYRQFPESWQVNMDIGYGDPNNGRDPQEFSCSFLRKRFRETSRPCIVLALGPLTNIALALRDNANPAIVQLVCMGGAFGVPGNLIHGSETQEPAESIQPPKSIFSQLWSLFGSHSGSSTAPSSGSTHSTPQFPDSVTNKLNRKAEWNIYIDPEAAEEVFSNKAFPQLLVGLDVTNKVPVTIADVEEFEIHQRMLHNIGKTIWTLLKENMEYIEAGEFFAWDQLAAMTLVDDSIVKSREAVVNVIPSTSPDEDSVGQTIAKWAEGSNVRVAIEADAKRFHDMFLKAFINENAFR